MKDYEFRLEILQSLIIKDFNDLCKKIAFNSYKAKETLLNQNSVNLNFNDLYVFDKVELAIKINKSNNFNLNIDKAFLVFEDSEDWKSCLIDNENEDKIIEFIELVEAWSLNIILPNYIEDNYLFDSFDERFEGLLYFFFLDLIDDISFSDTIRRNYFKKILDSITESIHYHNILLNSLGTPSHLITSFTILKKEYIKAYNLIYDKLKVQIGGFYDFDNKLLKVNNSKQEKRYFNLNDDVHIDEIHFDDLTRDLCNELYLPKNFNYKNLKKVFSKGVSKKINWIGGKGKLGTFIKLLKNYKIITDAKHFEIAKNIFLVEGEEIDKIREDKPEDSKKYIQKMEKIIKSNFIPYK